jgi:hypothetical protein
LKRAAVVIAVLLVRSTIAFAQGQVYVSRFWHNHQPIYWPEWNGNGAQTSRVQYAWDSLVLQPNQTYGTGSGHPDTDLAGVFGLDDRKAAYQGRPRDSLASCPNESGFALSYTGSLIDNVRNLAANNQLGYGSGWWDGNRQAKSWTTPLGSRRLDLVGFNYHHSLGPLLPKSVFRKELEIFKQAWWKAWSGSSDLSDHSRGYFPTEMAFSESMIDVLADEGYQWSIVASHHLSRTCPTYFNQFDLAANNYNIFSSPPNKSDLLGPSPTNGWWYGQPNPGNAAWNVAPFAYQLHRAKYVDPNTGAEKFIILVPSDDVLSYRYGYANEGIGKIQQYIAPFATDSSRPALVMPASDGDNAWGGGYSSWMEATPQFFNESKGAGYVATAVQDMVNTKPPPAGELVHVEDGSWIFPETDYGSPYFLKWMEPPVGASGGNFYPGTKIDIETPGFSTKFWSWAVIMTGANWCETAEQIWRDEGGSVATWKIQAPYDWDNSWTSPNDIELAWHIYLCGLDSGFNYYGGLGNDDEVKAGLATRRAIEKLSGYVSARLTSDHTPPTVLRPQRFPWNPGGYTFGWFNVTTADNRYLKKMPSDFYVWTHAYDVSGVGSVSLKMRVDLDGANPLSSNQNETYAGGSEVGAWIAIPMTKRVLPKTTSELNAAANNSQINYFITPPALADYYFAKIDNNNIAGFRGKLLDYYIEASDTRGNVSKSDIQHVFIEDDGAGPAPTPTPTPSPTPTPAATPVPFTLNGQADAAGYIQYPSGMSIYAAVRAGILYVATWSPGTNGANDHFIFVSDQLLASASAAAPWAKAGLVAVAPNKPFIGGESVGSYVGWFNAPPSSQVVKSANNGEQMEGVVDLTAAFGSIPKTIYLAAAAYATTNGGALVAQGPAGNGDGNIGPNEFMALPIVSIKDENADGKYDRLDPAIDFVVAQIVKNADGSTTITWNSVPGKSYQLEYCDSLGGAWNSVGNQLTAAVGQLTLSANDSVNLGSRFYRVRLVNP